MDRWIGKVAIVTGASSGSGRATAIALANYGLKIVGLARRVELIEAASKEVKSGKGSLKGVKCDVRKTAEIKSAFEWVEKNVGPVSILINNAAVFDPDTIADISQEDIDTIIGGNLIGYITCAKEALSCMSRHGIIDGHIVNVNSACGRYILPIKSVAMYSSSKFGIRAFTEALKNELALDKSKIRITSIVPGLVDTPMAHKHFNGKVPEDTPVLHDKDIADCIIFSLSAPKHVNISEIFFQGVGEIYTG